MGAQINILGALMKNEVFLSSSDKRVVGRGWFLGFHSFPDKNFAGRRGFLGRKSILGFLKFFQMVGKILGFWDFFSGAQGRHILITCSRR